MNLKNKKFFGLVLTIFTPLILLYIFKGPLAQDQAYHNFVDKHSFIGIPNFHNVMSNLPFVLVAILGFIDMKKYPGKYTFSWGVFFTGVLLVAPGSAYYHWNPNDATLVWDRIPMTIGFMGLVASIFVDVFKIKNEKAFTFGLLALGVYTVIHWAIFGDLRIYAWLQGTTILVMFYMGLAYKESHLSMPHLLGSVAFYVAAKMTESNDVPIFESLSYSGHSIKHLLAAVAVMLLVLMKRKLVHENS